MSLAYVQVGATEWSIARIDIDDGGLEWWCGRHDWVSPHSSFWQLAQSCWNETFTSLQKARAFARSKGWER